MGSVSVSFVGELVFYIPQVILLQAQFKKKIIALVDQHHFIEIEEITKKLKLLPPLEKNSVEEKWHRFEGLLCY